MPSLSVVESFFQSFGTTSFWTRFPHHGVGFGKNMEEDDEMDRWGLRLQTSYQTVHSSVLSEELYFLCQLFGLMNRGSVARV